jgi:hypothetical protein
MRTFIQMGRSTNVRSGGKPSWPNSSTCMQNWTKVQKHHYSLPRPTLADELRLGINEQCSCHVKSSS